MTTRESRGLPSLRVAAGTDCSDRHQSVVGPHPTLALLPLWEGIRGSYTYYRVQNTVGEDCLLGQAKHIYQAQFRELS